jgi:subtilisin family serine protease
MKKIFFGPKGTAKQHEPFWKPWGCLGCLGRILLYVILLFFLMFLLNLFKMCSCTMPTVHVPDDILNPTGPDPVHVPIDTAINYPGNIPNPGENLPSPEDNYLPPVNDDDIITDDSTHQQIVKNKINVLLDSDSGDETFNQFADEFKALYPSDDYKIVYYDPLTKLMQIEVPETERENLMRNLPSQITDISFKVFPENLMGSLEMPNDPVFNHEEVNWYFGPIQAYEAWDITKGSPEITVAIVDSYFDLDHDDLNSNRIVSPFSVPRRTGNVAPAPEAESPCFEHGSMVASQALGTMNNQRGSTGIAPECKFMPISMGHRFTSMTILQGILYAIYQGANVINISAGSVFDPAVHNLTLDQQIEASRTMGKEEEAVWSWTFDLANQRNVTIVWAAGNDDILASLDASKRDQSTIIVSALDRDLSKASFSNYGHFPEREVEVSTISAPGVDIMGAKPYNTYDVGPGTSFAAPIVTGAVALLKSVNPSLTNAEIIEILQETGLTISGNENIGKLLQIKDALLRAQTQQRDNPVRMDDILSDHSRFIGLWRSEQILHRITSDGQSTNDEIRMYFNITSENAGEIIYFEASTTRKDYKAPVTVSWFDDHILLHQTEKATAEGESRNYTPVDYTCVPDNNGMLATQYTTINGSPSTYTLRHVQQRQD